MLSKPVTYFCGSISWTSVHSIIASTTVWKISIQDTGAMYQTVNRPVHIVPIGLKHITIDLLGSQQTSKMSCTNIFCPP